MLKSRFIVRRLALCAVVAATPALAGPVAIYTNIDGHPTAQVPGVPGEQFRAPLAPFLSLYGSPDGSHWIFKGFTDNADRDVIVVGTGAAGTTVAKEGDPSPIGGLTYGFMDSDCGVNDAGRYIFGNRLAGGPTTTDEILFRFDGADVVTAAREGDAAPGLFDPNGAGDELFGNSLNSAHLLNDDTPAFRADLIQNIATDFRSALYHGATVVAQEGTAVGTVDAGGDVYDSFASLSGNTFSSSADGSSWIVEADLAAGAASVEGVVVDDTVVVRDGDNLGLGALVDAVFAVETGGGGDWLARGDLVGDNDWVVRNGTVVAATGQPITPGNLELYGASILSIHSNSLGDWVVAADTSGGRQVVVRNGVEVVASTDDEVDLGLGPSSVAFVNSFDANDVLISDLGEVYAFVSLRDDAFQDIGDALVVYPLNLCPWDCELTPDGAVGINDFLALLAQWGQIGTSCDADGGGVGINDFLDLLAHWGPCP